MLKSALQKLIGTPEETDVLSIILLESKASRTFYMTIANALYGFDITPSEWTILDKISKSSTCNPLILAHALNLKPSYITSCIKKFIKNKIITIEPDPKDRRFKNIKATAKGEVLYKNASEKIESHLEKLFENISSKDIEGYTNTLKDIGSKKLLR